MGTADYSSAQSTLLALMNSAPAELLHPLIDAALQPLLARIFSQLPGWEEEFASPVGCDPWPKKR